jgi:signal transduction histidine kinase/tetratricopeptide (TPR) repeat protein
MQSHDALIKKIDDLNSTAWSNRVNDSQRAIQYSKEAIQLSREINYKKGLANALVLKAFGYIRTSDFDKATASLDEAETIYNADKNIRGLASINEYKGIIERYHGNSARALEYIFKALEQSRQTAFQDNEVTNLYQIGVTYRQLANYDKALEYLYDSLSLARELKFVLMEGYNLNVIGSIYFETEDYNQALIYFKQALLIREHSNDKWGEAGSLDSIGFTYFKLEHYTEAADYCKKSLAITKETGDKKGEANSLLHLAEIYGKKKDVAESVRFSNESLQIRKASGDRRGEAEILLFLAELYTSEISDSKKDKILQGLSDALKICEEIKAYDLVSRIHFYLYQYYKYEKNYSEAINHLELQMQMEKDLHKNTVNQKVLNLEISYKAEVAKKEARAIKQQNEELTRLNKEIEKQKQQLEEALNTLRNTQAQLIHSEKMASLGELTAGIAHEIQNPLNFVNNFSEVNKEMIEELLSEKSKVESKTNEELENEILNDIKNNSEKINHHGKLEDAIVKNMLQHSRKNSGQKEPTDINALCNEYLRLSFHGMRAKDKNFNAEIKTDFDNTIGNINIVPQDIGRVLLNLYNNAFYAVTEKKTVCQAELVEANQQYQPTVSVSSKKINNAIELTVTDNGNGIPENIIDKIFQPFFTTKPTGQGTGLGLSLSYDIIKAHGGEIKVETKEGEGTTFVLQLPIRHSSSISAS